MIADTAWTAHPTAVTSTASAGNYCIRVYDGGNIAAGVTVGSALQVQHC
jgi:hypothetical protein